MAEYKEKDSNMGLLFGFTALLATQGLVSLPSCVIMVPGTIQLQSAKVRLHLKHGQDLGWLRKRKKTKVKTTKTDILFGWTGICPRPRPPYKGRLLGNKARFLDGDVVIYSCDSNHDLFGKDRIRCVGKNWDSSAPVCNGELVLETSLKFDHICTRSLCILFNIKTNVFSILDKDTARTFKWNYGFQM